MRIAALYDIHGNLPALEAVLHELRSERIARIVVGGDVFPGPMPRESLARLLEIPTPTSFIRGNGDRAVLEHLAGIVSDSVPEAFRPIIRWTAEQLDAKSARIVSDWPDTVTFELPSLGTVLFCHATPRSDSEIFTRLTPEAPLLPIFSGGAANVVVCGHTHMQFQRTVAGVQVVNAGSVGMPFGEPGAYWLLLDGDIELRRTGYDRAAAAQRIRATTYPQAELFAANNVLQCPGEEEMLGAFSRAQVR